MSFTARFNCPGCGSPLETPEGTISIRCNFCNLVMRIGSPDRILKYFYPGHLDDFALKFSLERHFKENIQLQDFRAIHKTLYFLPFYRFRGMAYALISEKKVEFETDESEPLPIPNTLFYQKCRHFDLTIPGFDDAAFGLDTLGIRPAVVPLSLFDKDALDPESALLDITLSPADARQRSLAMFAFNLGFTLDGKECLISEIVGTRLSVIYYPVWGYSFHQGANLRTAFIDGLSKRVMNIVEGEYGRQAVGNDQSHSSHFSPVPHRCPNCGADFPVSESSIVYYCSNCSRFFIIDEDSYSEVNTSGFVYEPSKGHYPFWKFPITIGSNLKTVGQFSKILTGEIPLIAKDKAQQSFFLYVPAFSIPNLESLTTIGLRLCRTQPLYSLSNLDIAPSGDTVLSRHDAREIARFYWAIMRSRYRHLFENKYDLGSNSAGPAELVWVTLSIPGARKPATADSFQSSS